MKRLLPVFALTIIVLCTSGVAVAYDTMGPVWNLDFAGGETLPWVLNNDACPDMSFDQTQEIMERSFDAWEDVDCSTIAFSYEGGTDETAVIDDGLSLMVWRTSEWPYGMGALGITSVQWSGSAMINADIEFNSVHYHWADGGSMGATDLESVAVHEIGHLLGLDHSEYTDAIMYFAYTQGTTYGGLSDDDISGVCYLYPAEGGGCATESDCPAGHECVAGDCVPTGGGAVCSRCSNDDQCGDSQDACVEYPSGGSRCGRACDDDADCDGAPGCESRACECAEIAGGGSRQCVAEGLDCSEGPECDDDTPCPDDLECVDGVCVEGGCTELGDECEEHDDCCSLLCVDGLCSQDCDWLNPADSCPSGFYCSIRECGVGVCLPGRLGGLGTGASCDSHEECRTGYCAATGGPTTCQTACDPGGIETCPDDENCYQIGGSSCGICACQISRLGDPCDASGDCASGTCATKSGDRRCSRVCSSSNPCPEGYDCLDAGRFSICWPSDGGLNAECDDDDDCTDGECVGGLCTRGCETDCDCATGFECREVDGDDVCVEASGGGGGGCDCAISDGRQSTTLSVFFLLFIVGRLIWSRETPNSH